MSIDLAPAAAASPRAQRVVSHARIEATLLLRNGEQLLLALVIPAALLIAGLLFGGRFGVDPRTFPASVMALALWSTAFTSLAINTGFERRYGVLERLVATPLTKADLIAGKALATAAITAGQLVLLAVLGVALGWRPSISPVQSAILIGCLPLAAASFAGFALALAGRLQAEITLAVANLIYLVVAGAGAVILPMSAYPASLRPILTVLPFGALGEALRAWASGTTSVGALAVLAAWAAVSLLIARKAFRWIS